MRTHDSLVAGVVALATMAGPLGAQALAPDTSWVRRSALYEVFVQDFSPSGDFRGVIAGLDRIQSAGADVVWLMPIHPIGEKNRKGTLGSPYAPRDYRAINPAYGTADDFRALVAAVHARGMKLILDWVPDHTSPDHAWVTDHPDYYFRDAQGVPMVPRDADGKLTDWTDVAQLDFGNPALRREMTTAMQWWLTEFGIDGFRVDVAGFVPIGYWREALPALRAAVPRPILLLAEWGDLALHGAGFDLTYGWDAYKRLKKVWGGGSASDFIRDEVADLRQMPPGGMRLRFTTNHDETAWDKPPVAIFGAGAGARAAFAAITLLPGRPLLYNGQEVESPQALPLFERELVQWDQPQADSAGAFYRRILELTRTQPALIRGDFVPISTDSPHDVMAYRRGGIVVLVNPRPRAVRVHVTGIELGGRKDLLTGRTQRGDRLTLPAHGVLLLQ